MKKGVLGISLLAAVFLGAGLIKLKVWDRSASGSLQISTSPKTRVFLDGQERGVTPFLDDGLARGEYELKLVTAEEPILNWEGRIKINSGARTVVNRNLTAEGENYSSGEVLTLEKIETKDRAALTVVSIPDQAVIKIDGQPKGFAPVSWEELTPGDYQVSVALPGFEERLLSTHTAAGYKLIISVQLAQTTEGIQAELADSLTPTPEEKASKSETSETKSLGVKLEKPYVTIKETPTGFLRVREVPQGKEIARVKPGESFALMEKDEKGWYKIKYTQDKQGWISSVYAELTE